MGYNLFADFKSLVGIFLIVTRLHSPLCALASHRNLLHNSFKID